MTRLSPCPFLPLPCPLLRPPATEGGASVFPSRLLGLFLSPGPAGDVSHRCAEDALVTGKGAAAGGGAGSGEGAPTSSCSPAPWPGTASWCTRTRPPGAATLCLLSPAPPPDSAGARPRPAPPVRSALRAHSLAGTLASPPTPGPGWFRKLPYSSSRLELGESRRQYSHVVLKPPRTKEELHSEVQIAPRFQNLP